MVTKLVIAGHGELLPGFDPGAIGFVKMGEHKYYEDVFFPAVRKYLPDNSGVVLFSDYNVYDEGNLVNLARKYGKDTQVIEMHFDASDSESANGGHVIIHAAYEPDALDLKLRDWIKKHIGVRYSHKGQAGISGRSELRNCNLAKAGNVNYRLIELGFGTNRKDADIMLTTADVLAKDFVLALCGKIKQPAKPQPTPSNLGKFVHTVRSGDTLWDIAVANGLTLAKIRALNPGIKDAIYPDQKINLGTPRIYTVKPNDTLSGIGAKLGVKWQTIASMNNVKSPYVIQPGQKLRY